METCVRGFSYMPESNRNVNLQYIENDELERAWKINRRQRLKDQEQRIWEDFVKEQDMVQKAYAEDPYQFLHKLPEGCLKELMETELSNMKKETEGATVLDQPNQGEGDHPTEKQIHSVTFAEGNELRLSYGNESPDLVMFQIFDDDTDLNQSGGEEDQPESPSTVRERSAADDPASPPMSPCTVEYRNTDGPVAPKSAENVSNVIESSIYCARVKAIRLKLCEEMVAIMASLDIQDVMSVDRQEVARRCRRAAEFCARFNRVHMYQLQRQIHNLKRHVSKSLPLAQHTQFQSQMLRVVSLHQNMLQALQVFHKSFPATSCLRECGRALAALCGAVRAGGALGGAVRAPAGLRPAGDLCDELLQTCDKLDIAINEYTARVADFLSAAAVDTVEMVVPPSTSSKTKKSKKVVTSTKTAAKCSSNKGTEARLSMYSLDTQRLAKPSKTASRDSHSSGTSKRRVMLSSVVGTKVQPDKDKASKKSSRRPLVRGPQAGAGGARARPARGGDGDGDVSTMVEAVRGCESSHVLTPRSRGPSPRAHSPRARTSRHNTPRQISPLHSPSLRNAQNPSPSLKHRVLSPKVHKSRHASPKNQYSKGPSTTTSRNETPSTVRTPVTPVTKIQCAKKTPRSPETSPNRSGKSTDRSRNLDKSTDRTERPRTDKSTGRNKENDRGYDFGVSSNDRECDNCKGTKVDKIVGRGKVDNLQNSAQLENDPAIDTYGSNGLGKDVLAGKVVRPGHIGNPGKEDNTGREFCGVKELTDNDDDYSRRYAKEIDEENAFLLENGINMSYGHSSPPRCDVTRLLRQLCSGDPAGPNERVTGAKNAQLLCITGGSSPRQPSTPQLLRILEETIQKQSPRPVPVKPRNPEKYRLSFNIPENVASRMFQYRTKFVQHMLTSPLYANSAVGKPWEMIGGVSDKIIDALLTNIAKEMEINHVLRELYKSETN